MPEIFAGVAQLVEHDLAKVGVAGSSPVSRSKKLKAALAVFFYYSQNRLLNLRDLIEIHIDRKKNVLCGPHWLLCDPLYNLLTYCCTEIHGET